MQNRTINVFTDRTGLTAQQVANKLQAFTDVNVIVNGAGFCNIMTGEQVDQITFVNISNEAFDRLRRCKVVRDMQANRQIKNFGSPAAPKV